jgi:hypothetical protein
MLNQHKDKIIIVLLLIVIALMAYIGISHRAQNSALDRDPQRRQGKPDFKNQDVEPYEKNEVKNTILKNAADPIQVCFKEFMAKNPKFEMGRITVDWQIRLDGTVDKPEIVNSEIPEINGCVIDNLVKLKFPPPPSGKPWYIVHKFFFKKENSEGESKTK